MAGGFSIFGLKFGRDKEPDRDKQVDSIIPPESDGSSEVISNQSEWAPGDGQFMVFNGDLSVDFNSQKDRINYYRNMARNAYVDACIDDIVNEAISKDENEDIVRIMLDDTSFSDKIKKRINEEFKQVLYLLNFGQEGSDLFRDWYIDGVMYISIVVDKDAMQNGIVDFRLIDPRKVKKIVEVTKDRNGMIVGKKEYYLYIPDDVRRKDRDLVGGVYHSRAVKLTKDSVIYCWSGLLNNCDDPISYLDRAVIPYNQLNAIEEALLIYRMSRAPEKRLFNVETGDLPTNRAEQYVKRLINKFKNRVSYNPQTGEIRNSSHLMSMFQDYWLPQKNGKGTTISTIGGTNGSGPFVSDDELSNFMKKLYQAMKVPFSRHSNEGGGILDSRGSEISRDEIKFYKFIDKLRSRFSSLFMDALRTQLLLKNVITQDEWEQNLKHIRFQFVQDSLYYEMKEAEILSNRVAALSDISQYTVAGVASNGEEINRGAVFFSKKYVQKHVLRMTDEEIDEMEEEIDQDVDGAKQDQDDSQDNDAQPSFPRKFG